MISSRLWHPALSPAQLHLSVRFIPGGSHIQVGSLALSLPCLSEATLPNPILEPLPSTVMNINSHTVLNWPWPSGIPVSTLLTSRGSKLSPEFQSRAEPHSLKYLREAPLPATAEGTKNAVIVTSLSPL